MKAVQQRAEVEARALESPEAASASVSPKMAKNRGGSSSSRAQVNEKSVRYACVARKVRADGLYLSTSRSLVLKL